MNTGNFIGSKVKYSFLKHRLGVSHEIKSKDTKAIFLNESRRVEFGRGRLMSHQVLVLITQYNKFLAILNGFVITLLQL